MTEPIRVGIVDDHPVVREGLRVFLNASPDVQVTVECGDGPAALRTLESLPCDVLLLDLRLKGRLDGVALFDALAQRWPALRVIVLTSYRDPDSLDYLARRGVAGYLDKTVEPDDLLEAIRQVAKGRSVWDRAARPQPGPTAEPFTPREDDVLALLAEGLANKEIADRLGIREKTVKVHVSHILAKLHVYDRTQAVIRAHQLGLVRLKAPPAFD